jgi:hypothetical protein
LTLLRYASTPKVPFENLCAIFKVLGTFLSHRKGAVLAPVLIAHYETFAATVLPFIRHENYVARRLALEFLLSVLHCRACHSVLVSFINNENHLMEVMKGISGTGSRSIQMQIFSVFILFASNPHKSPKVYCILQRNKERIRELVNKIGQHDATTMCLEFCENFDEFIDMRAKEESVE